MKIALDKNSKRQIDENGFLHVSISNISKECVSPYYGYEIPNYKELGLDAQAIYYAYRKGSELENGAKSFNGLPLLRDHYIEHAENPQKEHRVGSLGTDAIFEAPYLKNSIIVTDAEAIRKIESRERIELSAAYAYTPLFEEGIFEGQEYDFIMTNIRGNHVALVEEGRVGKDVVVADSLCGSKSICKEEEMQRKQKITGDNEKAEQEIAKVESRAKAESNTSEKVGKLKENTATKNVNEAQESQVQVKEAQESQEVTPPQKEAKLKKYKSKLESLKVEKELKEKLIKKLPNYIQSIRVLNELLRSLMAIDEVISSKNECEECEAQKSVKDNESIENQANSEDSKHNIEANIYDADFHDEADDDADNDYDEETDCDDADDSFYKDDEEDKDDYDDDDEIGKAMDSMNKNLYDQIQAKLKSQIKTELQDVQSAIHECTPLVGELDLFAFDSANAVYLQACNLLELSASKDSAKDVIHAFTAKGSSDKSSLNTREDRVFQSRFQ